MPIKMALLIDYFPSFNLIGYELAVYNVNKKVFNSKHQKISRLQSNKDQQSIVKKMYFCASKTDG